MSGATIVKIEGDIEFREMASQKLHPILICSSYNRDHVFNARNILKYALSELNATRGIVFTDEEQKETFFPKHTSNVFVHKGMEKALLRSIKKESIERYGRYYQSQCAQRWNSKVKLNHQMIAIEGLDKFKNQKGEYDIIGYVLMNNCHYLMWPVIATCASFQKICWRENFQYVIVHGTTSTEDARALHRMYGRSFEFDVFRKLLNHYAKRLDVALVIQPDEHVPLGVHFFEFRIRRDIMNAVLRASSCPSFYKPRPFEYLFKTHPDNIQKLEAHNQRIWNQLLEVSRHEKRLRFEYSKLRVSPIFIEMGRNVRERRTRIQTMRIGNFRNWKYSMASRGRLYSLLLSI